MEEKQINKDWTIKEWRNPRKNDVVIDPLGEFGLVVLSKGDHIIRNLWVENIDGDITWENVPPKDFTLCTQKQTREFYLKYKEKKGWHRGKIYTVVDKDYPLLLIDMEYDLYKQEMVYVFRDLSSPEKKFFKTLNESLLSFVEGDFQLAADAAFIEDDLCSLRYRIDLQLIDRGEAFHEKGWNVSGSSLLIAEQEQAQEEIDRWLARMKIRRVASVLSKMPMGIISEVALSEQGELYARESTGYCGQPAIFNSKVAAGIAIATLPAEVWKKALLSDIDNYMS
jgi:hypothetical protein